MALLLYDIPLSRVPRRRPVDLSSLLMPDLDELLRLQMTPRRRQDSRCGRSEVVNASGKFQIQLDVSQYQPEELSVKTVDNSVVIHGKHEEKEDEHGWVSREFTRRYMLPPDVDPQALSSTLTAEGVLTLEAPKKQLEQPKEQAVPITVEHKPSGDAADNN